jgi:hypothetical protein
MERDEAAAESIAVVCSAGIRDPRSTAPGETWLLRADYCVGVALKATTCPLRTR